MLFDGQGYQCAKGVLWAGASGVLGWIGGTSVVWIVVQARLLVRCLMGGAIGVQRECCRRD